MASESKLNDTLLRCRCEVLMHAELVNWQGYPDGELPDTKLDSINSFAELQINVVKLAIVNELQTRLGRRVTETMLKKEGLAWRCSGVGVVDGSVMAKETIASLISAMAADVIDLLHLPVCDLTETISEFIDEWTQAINEVYPIIGEEN